MDKKANIRKYAIATRRNKVLRGIMEQLKSKGAKIGHFEDLVHDYMVLWDTKEKLATDINERGVMYKDVSSTGISMQKNNPSVKEIVMVNRQMLAILKDLNLNTEDIIIGESHGLI